MQAIIMAAGKGTRLANLTNNKPKSFIEIDGNKLIEYNLDMLSKYGIKDVILVTGYMSEEFEKLLSNRKGIRLVLNPFFEITNVLASFWFGQEFLNDDFIYMHADTLCAREIFEDLLCHNGEIVLPVDFGPCDEEAMKVKLVNEEVKHINKIMSPKFADGEFIGIAKISKNCIPIIKRISNSFMKEQKFSSYFEVVLEEIILRDYFKVSTISTGERFWCEIDYPEDYEIAKNMFATKILDKS